MIAHGHDVSDDVLAGLAVLANDTESALQLPPVGTAGMLIAILGEIDVAAARRLVGTRPRGVQAVAMMLQVADWAGPADPVAEARNLLGAGGWRMVIIRRGDDLGEVWRGACRAGDGFASRFDAASAGQRNEPRRQMTPTS